MQNKAQLVLYDTKGNANNIYYEEETEGWLRIQSPLYHDQYVIIVKLQDSGTKAGRFLHATRFEYKNGALVDETDLTPGTNEVVSLLLVDHARSRLYYLGTELDKPSHKNLYSVRLGGTESPVCLSCELLTPEGKFFFFSPVKLFLFHIRISLIAGKNYRKSLHLRLRLLLRQRFALRVVLRRPRPGLHRRHERESQADFHLGGESIAQTEGGQPDAAHRQESERERERVHEQG